MDKFIINDRGATLTPEMVKRIGENITFGYISKTKHPVDDIYIYNYTNKCQIDWLWNDATKLCRGLILDKNFYVVGRSYEKFFTLDQIQDSACDILPPRNMDYDITHKKDGFLGIVYYYNGTWRVASRGSFTSEMAKRATDILYVKYPEMVKELNTNYSYVVEIIYPNAILTLNYGYEDLVLHGMFDNRTGKEIDLKKHFWDANGQGIARWPMELPVEIGSDWKGIEDFYAKYKFDDDEGYVITFGDDKNAGQYRLKVKFDEYKKLSHIKNSLGAVGSKRFVENVLNGSIEDIITDNPFLDTPERRVVMNEVYDKYESLLNEAEELFDYVDRYTETDDMKSFVLNIEKFTDEPIFKSCIINMKRERPAQMEKVLERYVINLYGETK